MYNSGRELFVPPLSPRLFRFCTAAIVVLVALEYGSYFAQTSPFTRSYDSPGHIAYVRYLRAHRTLPAPTTCWECYHPPLYYLLAAVCTSLVGEASLPSALQIFSLLLYALFLIFSGLALRRIFGSSRWLLFGLLLVAFWPSGPLQSVRVGNDSLLYVWYAAGFFSCLGPGKTIVLEIGRWRPRCRCLQSGPRPTALSWLRSSDVPVSRVC